MRKLLLVLASLPLVLGACGFSTKGDSGVARFQYSADLFGDAVDQPIMVGADEPMSVTTSDMSAREVVTSDPTVLQLTKIELKCELADGSYALPSSSPGCPSGSKSVAITFHAHALGTGSSVLQLRNASGGVIDSLTVSAAEARAVSFKGCADGSKPNTSCALAFEVRDARGRQLQASSGVHFSTDRFDVVGFLPLFGTAVPEIDAERGFLRETNMITRGAGTANVTAVAPSGAKTTKAVRVDP